MSSSSLMTAWLQLPVHSLFGQILHYFICYITFVIAFLYYYSYIDVSIDGLIKIPPAHRDSLSLIYLCIFEPGQCGGSVVWSVACVESVCMYSPCLPGFTVKKKKKTLNL